MFGVFLQQGSALGSLDGHGIREGGGGGWKSLGGGGQGALEDTPAHWPKVPLPDRDEEMVEAQRVKRGRFDLDGSPIDDPAYYPFEAIPIAEFREQRAAHEMPLRTRRATGPDGLRAGEASASTTTGWLCHR